MKHFSDYLARWVGLNKHGGSNDNSMMTAAQISVGLKMYMIIPFIAGTDFLPAHLFYLIDNTLTEFNGFIY